MDSDGGMQEPGSTSGSLSAEDRAPQERGPRCRLAAGNWQAPLWTLEVPEVPFSVCTANY